MQDEVTAIGAITASASAAGASSITLATFTSTAPGIMGALGFTTTTVVAVPVAGVVAAGGLLCYGAYKMHKHFKG